MQFASKTYKINLDENRPPHFVTVIDSTVTGARVPAELHIDSKDVAFIRRNTEVSEQVTALFARSPKEELSARLKRLFDVYDANGSSPFFSALEIIIDCHLHGCGIPTAPNPRIELARLAATLAPSTALPIMASPS